MWFGQNSCRPVIMEKWGFRYVLFIFFTESGFDTCLGWDGGIRHSRCLDHIRPQYVSYHGPTTVKDGIETVGA